jgi:hypothetical protein
VLFLHSPICKGSGYSHIKEIHIKDGKPVMNNSCEDEFFHSRLWHFNSSSPCGLLLKKTGSTYSLTTKSQPTSQSPSYEQTSKWRESQRLFNIEILRHVVTWSNTCWNPSLASCCTENSVQLFNCHTMYTFIISSNLSPLASLILCTYLSTMLSKGLYSILPPCPSMPPWNKAQLQH